MQSLVDQSLFIKQYLASIYNKVARFTKLLTLRLTDDL